MIYDPTYPIILEDEYPQRDWNNFYENLKEHIPSAMPKPLGPEVIMRMFVDDDYAGDGANRRSRTGFLIFLNEAPIAWYSNKQSRVENLVVGSDFIAMQSVLSETIEGTRYKLRLMGATLDSPTYIYRDNMSVIHNTSTPESTLKKKANSVCYHYIHEAVAAHECRTGHINTHENPADIPTKPFLPSGDKLLGKQDPILLYR